MTRDGPNRATRRGFIETDDNMTNIGIGGGGSIWACLHSDKNNIGNA